MEQLKEILAPFIDLLPADMRAYWWVIAGVMALMAALAVLALLRWLLRSLFGRRILPHELDLGPREELADYPLPLEPAGRRRLTVEGVPVRMRVVVIAPLGNQAVFTEAVIPEMLDRVLWGLGAQFQQDRPGVRLWPPQLSSAGFVAAFHRRMHKPEPEGQASHWILVAGQTPPRPHSFLLGLAMWGDQINAIGRLTLEQGQWANVLRIQTLEN